MSEQVGASLVLAQMLMPSQAIQAGSNGAVTGPSNGIGPGPQVIDSIDESAPVFASLLRELKNLEARTPASGTLDAEALIRIRVATQPGSGTQNGLPDGKPLPAHGGLLPDGGKTLPDTGGLETPVAEEVLQGTPTDAALLPGAEIVVREPASAARSAATAEEAAFPNANSEDLRTALQPASAAGSQLPAGTAATSSLPTDGAPTGGLPTSTTGAVNVSASPTPAPTSAETPARSAESLTAAVTGTNGSALGASSDEAAADGGEQQGHRQAQANLSSRGPSITFSLEGLPAATLTAPGSTIAQTPAANPVLAQPLTLLGAPAQWAEPLAERLAGLAMRGANTAEIRLHPPSLGQLEVRITLANDQASLFVASANPEVREALQQALPRLDNLLGGLGIELAESEIAERQADGSQTDGNGQSDTGTQTSGGQAEQLSEGPDASGLGLLDTWA